MDGESTDDRRLARLYADIDQFTSGNLITIGNDPMNKDSKAFMARTRPVQEAIFTIRSVDPSPAIRLFGAFCVADVFLGLTWRFRRDLGDRLFDFAVLDAARVWDDLLPDCRRLNGDKLEEIVSDKFYAV